MTSRSHRVSTPLSDDQVNEVLGACAGVLAALKLPPGYMELDPEWVLDICGLLIEVLDDVMEGR